MAAEAQARPSNVSASDIQPVSSKQDVLGELPHMDKKAAANGKEMFSIHGEQVCGSLLQKHGLAP